MDQSLNDIIPGLGLQNIIEVLLAFFLSSIRLSAFIIASPLFRLGTLISRSRTCRLEIFTDTFFYYWSVGLVHSGNPFWGLFFLALIRQRKGSTNMIMPDPTV